MSRSNNKPKLTQQVVRELLDYDETTGILTWRRRDLKWFQDTPLRTALHSCRIWNARYPSTRAFNQRDGRRHLGAIFGKMYRAAQIIWLWKTGEWRIWIDHKNRDESDDRWKNLRASDPESNSKNTSRQRRNKSGATGVFIRDKKHKKRYVAYIGSKGKFYPLGIFCTFEEALATRKAAEKRLGFSPGHGRLKPPSIEDSR